MKIRFLFVGKTKDSWIQEGEKEFLKWLKKFSQPDVFIVNESREKTPEKIMEEEGKNILKNIKDDEVLCLLDLYGKHLSSKEFAQKIDKWKGRGKVVFVVGGAWGLSDRVRDRADFCLKLSDMTFTHQMLRPFLMEQVYRAFTILQGSGYHK